MMFKMFGTIWRKMRTIKLVDTIRQPIFSGCKGVKVSV